MKDKKGDPTHICRLRFLLVRLNLRQFVIIIIIILMWRHFVKSLNLNGDENTDALLRGVKRGLNFKSYFKGTT